jgi:hypothetical protein
MTPALLVYREQGFEAIARKLREAGHAAADVDLVRQVHAEVLAGARVSHGAAGRLAATWIHRGPRLFGLSEAAS